VVDDPAEEFSPGERETLERGGVDLSPWGARREDGVDPLAESAARFVALLKGSLDVKDAAAVLGVNESRVRQRIVRDGTLYALKPEGSWLLPRFQFAEKRDGSLGGELPGLRRVLPGLDRRLHPLAVHNWFTSPNADLVVDGERLSPRAWLLSGGDPEPVAELAGALGKGL
jgi:hypothetical protein